ncbi:MAG: hypothetical protein KME30_28980 [Iphinoe sp. HA4291-MV1]|jgi:hypothetical protein|nr:hypothetical protein [Iphinoe sp. HA4291-MV1]
MPTVYLKNGEVVQVPIEELEDYLSKNKDKIQIRQVQRRGQQRKNAASKDDTAA